MGAYYTQERIIHGEIQYSPHAFCCWSSCHGPLPFGNESTISLASNLPSSHHVKLISKAGFSLGRVLDQDSGSPYSRVTYPVRVGHRSICTVGSVVSYSHPDVSFYTADECAHIRFSTGQPPCRRCAALCACSCSLGTGPGHGGSRRLSSFCQSVLEVGSWADLCFSDCICLEYTHPLYFFFCVLPVHFLTYFSVGRLSVD